MNRTTDKKKGRILGVDLGEKRIGLALSDPLGWTAQGLETLQVKSFEDAVKQVAAAAREKEADTIVLGLPYELNGSSGYQVRKTRKFGERLHKEINLPVVYLDERLSSRAAEAVLLQADLSRRRRRQLRDKLAAQIILQNYLDRKNYEDSPGISHPG